MPLLIGIVGMSGAGKTSLILKLIPELTSRGYKVGTVKNCPQGFDINREGKDSYKFKKQGSQGVLLTSPKKVAFIRDEREDARGDIIRTINLIFYNFDIVLVEGFSEEQRLRRIEILRKGLSEKLTSSPERLIGVVSDMDIGISKPIFKPGEIPKIVNFLEKIMDEEKKKSKGLVEVIVNGERVFLNSFLQDMVKGLTLSIVTPLRRKDKGDIKEIMIKVTRDR